MCQRRRTRIESFHMQIILVSNDFRDKRTLFIGWKQIALAVIAFVLLLAATATLANYLSLKYAATSNHPLVRSILLADQHAEAKAQREQLQANIDNLAIKLGEVQAHMVRLDGLAEKLAKVAGLKPQELPSAPARAGRGGPEVRGSPLSLSELESALNSLVAKVDVAGDQMMVLEALLVEGSAQRKFLPTLSPVENVSFTSNYGYRIDPFTGHQSFHEGIDFAAETGTPIVAAASGKVISVEQH
ncbi:MAG: M23 family metallopeptidase, partial [Casimicrobiaceae bacterium]